jgi:sortase B
MINKVLKVIDKIINLFIIIFTLTILSIGIYGVYDAYQIYEKVTFSDDLKKIREAKSNMTFEDVKSINSDIIGWIKISNTTIDYPILQTTNNQTYLNLDYKKEYNYAGSIFLDYRNDSDFSNDYNILYGHNLSVGGMFSDIAKYDDNEYFNDHLLGVLTLPDRKYKIEVITYSIINVNDNIPYNLLFNKNDSSEELLNYYKEKSIFINNIEYSSNDKLLLLSTCDNNDRNQRLVLLTRLVELDNITLEQFS